MSAPAVACPFCGSTETERVAAWGGQLIMSQIRCLGCNTYFEAVREDFDPERGAAAAHPTEGRT